MDWATLRLSYYLHGAGGCLLTKSAGLEGAGILASDLKEKLKRGVDKKTINEAIRNLDRVSVVPEALKAVETGYVSSLHTPTEGGVINGLLEMASAAKTGLLINEDGIPISPSTRKIAEALKLNPLRLLSSGALLLAVNRKHVRSVRAAISSIEVETSIIGEVRTLKEGRILLTKNGRKSIEPVEHDELYRILENC